jgi:hypothetical protein
MEKVKYTEYIIQIEAMKILKKKLENLVEKSFVEKDSF